MAMGLTIMLETVDFSRFFACFFAYAVVLSLLDTSL